MLGYGIAYGNKDNETSSSFLGNDNFFLMGDFSPSFFFFQYSFSATAVTIIAGTLAERCKMTAYVAYSVMMTAFVYPVVAHTFCKFLHKCRNYSCVLVFTYCQGSHIISSSHNCYTGSNQGYFSPSNVNPLIGIGMIDFSGSGVVHVTGGSVALYAAYILGARRGRFHDKDGRLLAVPGLVKGHSMALQMLGTILLWFCWYGFNSGSALLLSTDSKGYVAAIAAVNTTLSAVAATLSALFANGFLLKRQTGEFSLDIVMAMNGWYVLLVRMII